MIRHLHNIFISDYKLNDSLKYYIHKIILAANQGFIDFVLKIIAITLMMNNKLSSTNRSFGIISSFSVFALILIYVILLVSGLASLNSPDEAISDPYFSLLEILILLMMPMMIISFTIIKNYATPDKTIFGMTALIFIIITTIITSSVHFSILTVSRSINAKGFPWTAEFFSFKWPSFMYALDILAWDWFFPLSMFFAAPIFNNNSLEKWIRSLMILSGVLSLAGLIGIPLGDMQIRMIGVIGYVGVGAFVFLLLGFLFLKIKPSN